MRKPNFFIIGAPKTGTSAMAHYLSMHPQVFLTTPKEPNHFNSDHDIAEYRSAARYAGLFDGADERHRAVGEGSVWYLYSKVAVPRIEAELPGSKYIVMLRNPAEMAPSLHQQQVFGRNENIEAFEDAWRAQDRRRAGHDIPWFMRDVDRLLYKEACSLGTQLARLLDTVPRDRVLWLFNEDLRSDPRAAWCEVQAFLGLDDDGRETFPPVNVAKRRRSGALALIPRAYLALRRRYGVPPLGTGIFNRISQLNSVERSRPPLSPEIREMLREAFEPEVRLLESITNRDLSAWSDPRGEAAAAAPPGVLHKGG